MTKNRFIMVGIQIDLVLLLIFQLSRCERRIINGDILKEDKPYMVYLVKAPMSERKYDSWLCGGALVTAEFIITSAACVEDVRYMYAMAGYRKYVNDADIEQDECFKNLKKRIVYTCIPVSYEFNFKTIEKWSYIDIALVKVESPYNFDDARFEIICSYIPKTIQMNFEAKYQKPGISAMVLGWGHTGYWRKRHDHKNYNQDYLHYGTTILLDKNECVAEYVDYPNMRKIISKYMLCTCGDDSSLLPEPEQNTTMKDCITLEEQEQGKIGVVCEKDSEKIPSTLEDKTRKHMSLNQTNNIAAVKNVNRTIIVNQTNILDQTGTVFVNQTDIKNQSNNDNGSDSIDRTDFIYKPGFGNISGFFRRYNGIKKGGICQNDHGGPLVTWVGKKEVLIGVASVFRINGDRKCMGPFLFASTMCSSAFINCVLHDNKQDVGTNNENETLRNLQLCDRPPNEKGYDTIESFVSWKDHPDGPAENELLEAKFVP